MCETFYLNGCKKSDLPSNTPVVCKQDRPYYFWVKLPFHVTEPVKLYSVIEQCAEPVDIFDGSLDVHTGNPIIEQVDNCWVKISSAYLNLDPGQHVYKMLFYRKDRIDIEISLYFSYWLQDNNPDKPYKYMKKGDVEDV